MLLRTGCGRQRGGLSKCSSHCSIASRIVPEKHVLVEEPKRPWYEGGPKKNTTRWKHVRRIVTAASGWAERQEFVCVQGTQPKNKEKVMIPKKTTGRRLSGEGERGVTSTLETRGDSPTVVCGESGTPKCGLSEAQLQTEQPLALVEKTVHLEHWTE